MSSFYIKQNPMVTSVFVVTRMHCTKYFFSRITRQRYWPFVWMRHGRTLSNRTSGFMKDEKQSSFWCFFYRDRSVSILTLNLRILTSEIWKTQKELLQTYFLTSLSHFLLKTSVYIIILVFSWTKVWSVINETETILLCLKM